MDYTLQRHFCNIICRRHECLCFQQACQQSHDGVGNDVDQRNYFDERKISKWGSLGKKVSRCPKICSGGALNFPKSRLQKIITLLIFLLQAIPLDAIGAPNKLMVEVLRRAVNVSLAAPSVVYPHTAPGDQIPRASHHYHHGTGS